MNVDFRCEHCGKLLSAPAHANEPVRCPHCQKLTAVPAGLASLPRPKVQGEEAGAPLPAAPPGGGGPEEPQGAAPQGELVGALETMMPFVISLFFHLGLVLVTVFLTTTVFSRKEAPKEIVVPGTAISDNDEEAGGTLTPTERPSVDGGGGGSRFSKVSESSVRNSIIAAGGGSGDARAGMSMLGIGGAVGGTGTGTGTGTGPGWFSGGPPGGGFFGMGPGRGGGGGVARHFVYVVDRSGSMLNTFDAVKNEMMTSIGQLDGDKRKQDFHVILFADGPPLEAEAKRLVPANTDFQGRVTTWLKEQYAKGTTDPIPALTRAFDVMDKVDSPGGKVIFLLTDAAFPDNKKVVELCKARNGKRDVHIFTYLYGDKPKEAEDTMMRIAAEHGGKYKFVSAEE